KLTNLPPAKLREAIQIVLDHPDAELSNLFSQCDTAQDVLIRVAKDYTPDHMNYIAAKKLVDMWNSKIYARVEGIMIALQSNLDKPRATISVLSQHLDNARTNDLAVAERSRPYYAANQQLQDLIEFKRILGTRIANMKTELALPRPAPVEIVDRATPPLQ